MVMDSIGISMEEFIKGNGKTTWCMERAFINGKMGENMLVITKMTRRMDLEDIIGTMVEYFKGIGLKERDQEKAG